MDSYPGGGGGGGRTRGNAKYSRLKKWEEIYESGRGDGGQYTAEQSQKAVTAYVKSEQLLPLALHGRMLQQYPAKPGWQTSGQAETGQRRATQDKAMGQGRARRDKEGQGRVW